MIEPPRVNHNTPKQKSSFSQTHRCTRTTPTMTRSANTPTEHSTLVAFRVDADLIASVKATARAEDRSVSAVIRQALRAYTRRQVDDNPSE